MDPADYNMLTHTGDSQDPMFSPFDDGTLLPHSPETSLVDIGLGQPGLAQLHSRRAAPGLGSLSRPGRPASLDSIPALGSINTGPADLGDMSPSDVVPPPLQQHHHHYHSGQGDGGADDEEYAHYHHAGHLAESAEDDAEYDDQPPGLMLDGSAHDLAEDPGPPAEGHSHLGVTHVPQPEASAPARQAGAHGHHHHDHPSDGSPAAGQSFAFSFAPYVDAPAPAGATKPPGKIYRSLERVGLTKPLSILIGLVASGVATRWLALVLACCALNVFTYVRDEMLLDMPPPRGHANILFAAAAAIVPLGFAAVAHIFLVRRYQRASLEMALGLRAPARPRSLVAGLLIMASSLLGLSSVPNSTRLWDTWARWMLMFLWRALLGLGAGATIHGSLRLMSAEYLSARIRSASSHNMLGIYSGPSSMLAVPGPSSMNLALASDLRTSSGAHLPVLAGAGIVPPGNGSQQQLQQALMLPATAAGRAGSLALIPASDRAPAAPSLLGGGNSLLDTMAAPRVYHPAAGGGSLIRMRSAMSLSDAPLLLGELGDPSAAGTASGLPIGPPLVAGPQRHPAAAAAPVIFMVAPPGGLAAGLATATTPAAAAAAAAAAAGINTTGRSGTEESSPFSSPESLSTVSPQSCLLVKGACCDSWKQTPSFRPLDDASHLYSAYCDRCPGGGSGGQQWTGMTPLLGPAHSAGGALGASAFHLPRLLPFEAHIKPSKWITGRLRLAIVGLGRLAGRTAMWCGIMLAGLFGASILGPRYLKYDSIIFIMGMVALALATAALFLPSLGLGGDIEVQTLARIQALSSPTAGGVGAGSRASGQPVPGASGPTPTGGGSSSSMNLDRTEPARAGQPHMRKPKRVFFRLCSSAYRAFRRGHSTVMISSGFIIPHAVLRRHPARYSSVTGSITFLVFLLGGLCHFIGRYLVSQGLKRIMPDAHHRGQVRMHFALRALASLAAIVLEAALLGLAFANGAEIPGSIGDQDGLLLKTCGLLAGAFLIGGTASSSPVALEPFFQHLKFDVDGVPLVRLHGLLDIGESRGIWSTVEAACEAVIGLAVVALLGCVMDEYGVFTASPWVVVAPLVLAGFFQLLKNLCTVVIGSNPAATNNSSLVSPEITSI
ncbi:hypothetical protein H696_01142 [Fonticula alba]|uniref:Uncharacterized protein n=1 Tax=Fonticula alba TaxID=691883 RepID=A0A058ZBC0_FONAL|nr:hypothetical protein H696_01142 [Fonticula alba]KCV71720.1 hypothetical protein H696_01142 [Fonticula alba]|eukprot:XP_009493298.1 hypothetical protein H696_01142 [Fonticula alba]